MEITLINGGVTLVDPVDYERFGSWKWYRHTAGYAVTHNAKYLHRLILEAPSDRQVDHKNRDRLDNRRANLRLCRKIDNSRNSKLRIDNTTGLRGVMWDKGRKRWRAEIGVDGRHIYLGRFTDQTEAADAYLTASHHYFGEFAA